MATLRGKTLYNSYWDFELRPIPPTLEGDRNAYEVTLWSNNKEVFRRRYTVSGFILGHRDMFRVANAFQHAQDLMDLETTYVPNPPPFSVDKPYHDRCLCVSDDCGWFEFVLWGGTSRGIVSRGRRYFNLIAWFQTGEGKGHHELAELVEARISSWPEDIAAFGFALEQELVDARKQRVALGIPAPLDDI